jgi:predicted transcriptional regulator
MRKKMKKTHQHHAQNAVKADGTVDADAIRAGVAHWMKEMDAGRIRIVSAGELAVDAKHDVLFFVRETV